MKSHTVYKAKIKKKEAKTSKIMMGKASTVVRVNKNPVNKRKKRPEKVEEMAVGGKLDADPAGMVKNGKARRERAAKGNSAHAVKVDKMKLHHKTKLHKAKMKKKVVKMWNKII